MDVLGNNLIKSDIDLSCSLTSSQVFVFDDRKKLMIKMFEILGLLANRSSGIDTGELKYKTELANYEVQGIMSLTGPNPTPYSRDTRVDRYLFDLIWKRVQEVSFSPIFYFLLKTMEGF